jgi:hypothetical protein
MCNGKVRSSAGITATNFFRSTAMDSAEPWYAMWLNMRLDLVRSGTLANSLFVERQLRSTFAHRQEVLPELLL